MITVRSICNFTCDVERDELRTVVVIIALFKVLLRLWNHITILTGLE